MDFLRLRKSFWGLFLGAVLSFCFCLPVQAATPTATAATTPLNLQVQIDQPNIFWNCWFMTPGAETAKPATIKVEWNSNGLAGQTKQTTLPITNKELGQLTIRTEKNAIINIDISVWSANNAKLGSLNMQVINHGQTETVTIAPPERIEPVFTWGNS
ncbi:MAG: hypothetical protein H6Q65_1651 [Firmicutes bacterium]|nr:hypothetical protein [Bacillota bacterium]